MTPEEFKAEILNANPEAQFLEAEGIITCTPTEMLVSHSAGTIREVVVCFSIDNTLPIRTLSGNHSYMRCPPEKRPKNKRFMIAAECAGKWAVTSRGWHSLITDINIEKNLIAFAGGNDYTPEGWHKQGGKIADTATSEPYSLEIDE